MAGPRRPRECPCLGRRPPLGPRGVAGLRARRLRRDELEHPGRIHRCARRTLRKLDSRTPEPPPLARNAHGPGYRRFLVLRVGVTGAARGRADEGLELAHAESCSFADPIRLAVNTGDPRQQPQLRPRQRRAQERCRHVRKILQRAGDAGVFLQSATAEPEAFAREVGQPHETEPLPRPMQEKRPCERALDEAAVRIATCQHGEPAIQQLRLGRSPVLFEVRGEIRRRTIAGRLTKRRDRAGSALPGRRRIVSRSRAKTGSGPEATLRSGSLPVAEGLRAAPPVAAEFTD